MRAPASIVRRNSTRERSSGAKPPIAEPAASAEALVVVITISRVLELRPPIGAHKGTAVAHLLGERGLERALYAGDDTTDLDAFNALQGLELGVRVAVASAEGPPELREAADIVVDGPAELRELLKLL